MSSRGRRLQSFLVCLTLAFGLYASFSETISIGYSYPRRYIARNGAAKDVCGSRKQLLFARGHVRAQFTRLESEGGVFYRDDVSKDFNKTQSNMDMQYKFALVKIAQGHISIVGRETLDDFAMNCVAHIQKSMEMILHVQTLPDLEFIFTSLAALEQANIPPLRVPVFSACASSSPGLKHIYVPRVSSVLRPTRLREDLPRFERKVPKLFFRGALSGPERIALFKNFSMSHLTDIAMTLIPEGAPCDFSRRQWCAGAPQIWAEQNELNLSMSSRMPMEESIKIYRYILSIDGVGCADRLPALLSSASLIFVVESPFQEFWYSDLRPYQHYIPVKRDLSNLIEQVQWANSQPLDLLLTIISNANRFVDEFLGTSSLLCYYTEAFREYALKFRV